MPTVHRGRCEVLKHARSERSKDDSGRHSPQSPRSEVSRLNMASSELNWRGAGLDTTQLQGAKEATSFQPTGHLFPETNLLGFRYRPGHAKDKGFSASHLIQPFTL